MRMTSRQTSNYFVPTIFTCVARDQFEVWLGIEGVQSTRGKKTIFALLKENSRHKHMRKGRSEEFKAEIGRRSKSRCGFNFCTQMYYREKCVDYNDKYWYRINFTFIYRKKKLYTMTIIIIRWRKNFVSKKHQFCNKAAAPPISIRKLANQDWRKYEKRRKSEYGVKAGAGHFEFNFCTQMFYRVNV